MIVTALVCALAVVGILVRPFGWPEAVWAVAAAILIVALGLLPPGLAWAATLKGWDVYLFLIGMMLLSEIARREGLFDWVAGHAVNLAQGSARRLFVLVFGVGVVVTTFMSNDATAVVMTPAVFAAARQARVAPLPLLLSCAFVANAASFVLPISNPANIVLYGDHTPPLLQWLARFTLPSVLSIVATFALLYRTQRHALRGGCATAVPPPLGRGGFAAMVGLVLTAVALMVVSAQDWKLGLPTALLGAATAGFVLLRQRQAPWPVLREVSWSVLPLVAGLFVLVEAMARIGVVASIAAALNRGAGESVAGTAAVSAAAIAFGSNLVNNLPAGLLAASAIEQARLPQPVVDALLIGVDLGPNLSVTGSLATILWLAALRREGVTVGFWAFVKVGAIVMLPALVLAIAGRLLV